MSRTSEEQLQKQLRVSANQVQVGALYAHYKHPELRYKVVRLAILEASDEVCVIYTAQYGEMITFVRPLSSWLRSVTVGDTVIPRFRLISD